MPEILQTQQRHRKKINSRWEYAVIFWLIFLAASPFSMIHWIVDMYRRKSIFVDGPVTRAWLEAHRITPVIFSV